MSYALSPLPSLAMNGRWRWRLGAWTHSLRCTKVGIVVKHPHCATRHTALRRRSSVRLLTSFASQPVVGPLVGRSSLRVYPDQQTTSRGTRPWISGRRSRPLLVQIRAPLVRGVLLPGAVDMPANSLMSDSGRHTMSRASRSIRFRISSRRLQDPGRQTRPAHCHRRDRPDPSRGCRPARSATR